MKSMISKLAIAIIFSITLAAVVNISLAISGKSKPLQTATISQVPPGAEMSSGSCATLLNTLNEISWR